MKVNNTGIKVPWGVRKKIWKLIKINSQATPYLIKFVAPWSHNGELDVYCEDESTVLYVLQNAQYCQCQRRTRWSLRRTAQCGQCQNRGRSIRIETAVRQQFLDMYPELSEDSDGCLLYRGVRYTYHNDIPIVGNKVIDWVPSREDNLPLERFDGENVIDFEDHRRRRIHSPRAKSS